MSKTNKNICPECEQPLTGVGWNRKMKMCNDCAEHFENEEAFNNHLVDESFEDYEF